VSNAYACAVCADEIPSAATHYATEYAQVLCASCAQQPANHAAAYPDCPVIGHTIHDHACVVGTRLGAHRELLRMKRVRGVASG
jgi:hypothetical protein